MPWECYLATETRACWQFLRRYASRNADGSRREDCPLEAKYHNAMNEIEPGVVFRDKEGYSESSSAALTPHSDPRWPKACACGYTFDEKDEWQVFYDTMYFIPGIGNVSIHGGKWSRPRMRIGTLYDCWWINDQKRFKAGPDGLLLGCVLPDYKVWIIDGPSTQRPDEVAWTRSGIVPKITCSPSIDSDSYHGFLQNGLLTDDLSGRKYE